MDLDKSIDILIGRAVKFSTLDNFDDNLINHFDIVSDAEGVKQALLKKGYSHSLAGRNKKYNEIVNINSLLKVKDDYDFLELAYIKILNRPIDYLALKENLNALKNNEKTREQILKGLEDSPEGQDKQVFLTGFYQFQVSDYSNLSDIDFIKKIYIKILGRFADKCGLKDFLVRLKLQELTRNDVIKKIINSQEAKNKIIPKIIYDDNEKNNLQIKRDFIKDTKARNIILGLIEKDFDEYYELENKYNGLKKDINELKAQIGIIFAEINYIKSLESSKIN